MTTETSHKTDETTQKTQPQDILEVDVEAELRRRSALQRIRSIVLQTPIREVETTKERASTKIKKKRFLEAYEKTAGIKTVAIEKAGIGNKTLYRWMKDDPEFLSAMYEIEEGRLDMAEDRLLKLIQQDDGQSIRYFLDRMHPKYKPKSETTVIPQIGKSITEILWEEAKRAWEQENGIVHAEVVEPKQLDDGNTDNK